MVCPSRSSWFRRGLKWKGDVRCIERGVLAWELDSESNGRGKISKIIFFFLFKKEGSFDIRFLKVVRVAHSLRMDCWTREQGEEKMKGGAEKKRRKSWLQLRKIRVTLSSIHILPPYLSLRYSSLRVLITCISLCYTCNSDLVQKRMLSADFGMNFACSYRWPKSTVRNLVIQKSVHFLVIVCTEIFSE